MADFYGFTMKNIDGKEQALADYRDRVLLVVNVASKCGLTPQYKDLQALHSSYADKGFAVLGFPCNQFAGQEPGSDADVKAFCDTRYGVTFPLFSKIEVNGAGRAPLYSWLTEQATRPDGPGDVKWNFAKFLVGKKGQVVARFEPATSPTAPEVRQAIEKELAG
jgi:glutathione peroxidase